MGLDMYVYKTLNELPAEVDFDIHEDDVELLHRWRKHPNLHGWMEALYRSKGGKKELFNCVNVAISKEDLNELEQYILDEALPETYGFFFGASDGTEREDDLLFVNEGRAALVEGKHIFYRSWW